MNPAYDDVLAKSYIKTAHALKIFLKTALCEEFGDNSDKVLLLFLLVEKINHKNYTTSLF